MPRKFQFAFLGCHCSYVASVSYVNQSNSPYKASKVKGHGLPDSFLNRYREFSRTRYVSNVRGHDCFAFLGHWTKDDKGLTDKSVHLLGELDSLKVRLENHKKKNNTTYKDEDLLLSLGPTAGSYFVDAHNRYFWSGLPELEDVLQDHRYGMVFDITINSASGWVMQRDQGRSYDWGGLLPEELQSALKKGRERGAVIRNVYLNHQNTYDYVLLFADGYAHISLHHGFEKDMQELVEALFESSLPPLLSRMFKKPKKIQWEFIASCLCGKDEQRRVNAEYYNQRGRYHMRRSDISQALVYMREAHRLDFTNANFRDDYYMALVAASSLDPPVDDGRLLLEVNNVFYNQLISKADRDASIEALEERRDILMSESEMSPPPLGWKYEKPLDVPHELEIDVDGRLFELPSPHSEEVSRWRGTTNTRVIYA